MYARERIIRDRFAQRSCGRCGAHYTAESVVILARRPSHWMAMVSCPGCSQRNVYLISFADAESTDTAQTAQTAHADAATDTPLAPPAAHSPLTPSILPISDADVAAMHAFLQHFSGDFQTLFSTPHPHPHRTDDTSTS